MARKKKQIAEPEVSEQPVADPAAEASAPDALEHLSAVPVEILADGTPKTSFTEAEQAAYFAARQTTGERGVKGYDDIHDWHRRTKGGKVDA